MASKKYDWVAIKNDYLLGKYKDLKALAKAYGVSYHYMKTKAASWKTDKAFIQEIQSEIDNEISFLEEADRNNIQEELVNIPEDRAIWHKRLWDKLGLVAEKALNNPELHFFTHEGVLKTKALSDVAAVIEKVQKGQVEMKDDKTTGQLESYANLIADYRAKAQSNEIPSTDEEDEDENEDRE